MFYVRGFLIRKNFDTSNVEDMNFMFFKCAMATNVFSLGPNFDTSSVRDMSSMFSDCIMPEGFSLGDNFDTRNVIDMSSMFSKCDFLEGKREKDFNSEFEIIEWLKSGTSNKM